MGILKNKKLLIVICAALAIILTLLFWLITLVVQKNSFEKQVVELQEQIDQQAFDIEKYRAEEEYRQTVDYIIEWAEQNNMLTPDQERWIEENLTD